VGAGYWLWLGLLPAIYLCCGVIALDFVKGYRGDV